MIGPQVTCKIYIILKETNSKRNSRNLFDGLVAYNYFTHYVALLLGDVPVIYRVRYGSEALALGGTIIN